MPTRQRTACNLFALNSQAIRIASEGRCGISGAPCITAQGPDSDCCFMQIEVADDEMNFKTTSRMGLTVHSGMVRKNVFGGFVVVAALALTLSSCRDTKTREENEQLKAHVLQLQKDSGELGNRVEVLTNENAALKIQIEQLKKKSTAKKTAKPTTHPKMSRPRNSRQN